MAEDDDNEWPEDLQAATGGGDDAYGDQLDSGWMSGIRSQRLVREAELLVCCAMLKREDPERPCQWRDVFLKKDRRRGGGDDENDSDDDGDRGPTRFMDIKSIRDRWATEHTPLSGNSISALCLRFGPAYDQLQSALSNADNSEMDKAFLKKQAWDAFTPKKTLSSLTLTCVIDTQKVVEFLQEWELRLEIVEIQISRAGAALAELRGEVASSDVLTSVIRALGLPGIAPRQLFPLCQSAMLYARLQPDFPCPIAKLEKYCLARATRQQPKSASLQAQSAQALFRPLLRPPA